MESLLHLNTTDFVIIGILLASTLISLFRGLFRELMSLVIWIIGFWVAIKYFRVFATILTPHIQNETGRIILAFVILFLLVLIFGAMFNFLFSLLIVKTGLSGTDRVLGMFFGLVRGILLISVVLLLISTTSFVQDQWWQESQTIPHFSVVVAWLKNVLPQIKPVVSSLHY